MYIKKLLLLMVLTLSATGLIHAQSKMAVYVTDNSDADYARIVSAAMLRHINFEGTYVAVERTEEFYKILNKEHNYQLGGAVDDSQITELGKQFGVDYVLVVDISTMSNMILIAARIVDIETARIISSSTGIVSETNMSVENIETAIGKIAKELLFLD